MSCWIVEGDSADDFFRSDELHCRYRPELAEPVLLHSASFDITTSEGKRSGALLDSATDDTQVASFGAAGYPIELEVSLTYDVGDQQVRGIRRLSESATTMALAAPDEASEDDPVSVSLPFEIWELTLMNRHGRDVRLDFDYELPMEPEPHRAEARLSTFDFGLQTKGLLAVPRGATSLPASLKHSEGEAEVSVEGPGIYVIDEDGELSRVEPESLTVPSGQVTARCWIEESPSELVCSAVDHPGLASVAIEVAPAKGEAEILNPGAVPVRRSLEEGAFPLELGVATELAEDVAGMEDLESRVHHTDLQIEAPENAAKDAPATAALPFELWTIELIASDDLSAFGLDLMPRLLELGPNWGERFALRTLRERGPSLQPGAQATLLVAVTTGAEALEANAFLVDAAGTVTDDIELDLTPGTWRASASGVTKEDP